MKNRALVEKLRLAMAVVAAARAVQADYRGGGYTCPALDDALSALDALPPHADAEARGEAAREGAENAMMHVSGPIQIGGPSEPVPGRVVFIDGPATPPTSEPRSGAVMFAAHGKVWTLFSRGGYGCYGCWRIFPEACAHECDAALPPHGDAEPLRQPSEAPRPLIPRSP